MTKRAIIYCRISLDPTGKGLGVARQEKACRALAEARGWTVTAVETDNSISASSGKTRPAWRRVLQAVEQGDVDIVLAWAVDRMTRSLIDLEQLIVLAEAQGVGIATVTGDFDLTTDTGRMVARILAVVARAEVERKGARQKAANDQRAENGDPHAGRRCYGYTGDGRHIVPAEANLIVDAATRLIAGDSMNAITDRLNAEGGRTTAGNEWRTTEVRRMLGNPRYASLLVHRGEVVRAGTWPAILDDDTHRAVKAILDDPARRAPGRPQASLLTGIAFCGWPGCSERIYATRSGKRARMYYCKSRRHVTRQADPVDEHVTLQLLAFIEKHAPQILDTNAHDPALARQLRVEENELRARLDGLADAYAARDIDELQLRAGTRRLRNDLDAVTQQLTSLGRGTALARLAGAADVGDEWERMSLTVQRAALDEAAHVTLLSPGRGARSFRPDTIEVDFTRAGVAT